MKKEIIKDIVKSMHEPGITMNDLKVAMNPMTNCDLLCEVDKKLIRMPFSEGRHHKVIGIFHARSSNVFLYVEEVEAAHRKDADVLKLPTVTYWKDILTAREDMNKALFSLGLPEIDGDYFTSSSYLPTRNWIISFEDDQNTLKVDRYDYDIKAKIRYCGFYYKK